MSGLRAYALAAALIAAGFSGGASAQQLGSYGNVWEIAEPDAIDAIKGHLTKMEKEGELKKFWEDYRSRALNGIENPPPIEGITTAKEAKVWIFDPAIVYNEAVRDHLGNILVPAGTRVNPLDYINLSKSLIFIDGRDEAQVSFAKRQIKSRPRDKVILVGGSFLKLSREWKVPVYFDQQGALTRRFNIQRVPAVVSQKGKQLQIQEFAL
jgi:conjugal transfer pilus assembly protein TraW